LLRPWAGRQGRNFIKIDVGVEGMPLFRGAIREGFRP
jgi:hypothetical protein